MPLYEYRCPNGHVFELIHGFNDPQPEACVECGAAPVQRVLYPVAVHYKGSGFYSTDYGKGSRKAASKDGADGAGPDSGSTTDKPAADKPADKPAEKKAAEA